MWDTVKDQIRKTLEAEPFVVFRLAHKDTSFGSQGFQQGQSLMNERFPNTLFLEFRQHRDRAETIPILTAIGNGNRREGYMAYYLSAILCDQRNSQGISSPQCINYELLCMVAMRTGLESRFGDRG